MGNAISHILHDESESRQILVLGLDNSGKSSILYALNMGIVSIEPIMGGCVEIVSHDNITITSWTVNSDTSISGPWRGYYTRNTVAIIFVVDSCDFARLSQCSHELHRILDEDELKSAALLVLANKQDLHGAKSVNFITEALNLSAIKGRKWKIQACVATSGEGLYEGMRWLFSIFNSDS